jgi:hypothetical protein
VEEDFYSVDVAAKILKLTPSRIRQILRAGELKGLSPEESGERGWLLRACDTVSNGLPFRMWERTVQANQARPTSVYRCQRLPSSSASRSKPSGCA